MLNETISTQTEQGESHLPLLEQEVPLIEGVTDITVTYRASINIGNYSSFGGDVFVKYHFASPVTGGEASKKFAEIWRQLHQQFGEEAQEVIQNSMVVDFSKIFSFPKPLHQFIAVFKTLWGKLGIGAKQ